MEEQILPSTPPQIQPPTPPQPGAITPEMLQALKEKARQQAIQMAISESQIQTREKPLVSPSFPSVPAPNNTAQPKVVYVRRNLTVAELILIFAISCGLVTGVQFIWNGVSNFLPRLEIKVK